MENQNHNQGPSHSKFKNSLLLAQRRIADFLQTESDKLSSLHRKALFFCIVLLVASLSVKSFVSVFGTDRITEKVQVGSILLPTIDTSTGIWKPLVSEEEYAVVLNFKKSMDSLNRSGSGRIIYDSLRRYRKGLFDSVDLVIGLYLNHL